MGSLARQRAQEGVSARPKVPSLKRPCLESGRAWASATRAEEARAILAMSRRGGRSKVYLELLRQCRDGVLPADLRLGLGSDFVSVGVSSTASEISNASPYPLRSLSNVDNSVEERADARTCSEPTSASGSEGREPAPDDRLRAAGHRRRQREERPSYLLDRPHRTQQGLRANAGAGHEPTGGARPTTKPGHPARRGVLESGRPAAAQPHSALAPGSEAQVPRPPAGCPPGAGAPSQGEGRGEP